MVKYNIPVFLAGYHIFGPDDDVTVPGICPKTEVLVKDGASLTVTGEATDSTITVEPLGRLNIKQKDGVIVIQLEE